MITHLIIDWFLCSSLSRMDCVKPSQFCWLPCNRLVWELYKLTLPHSVRSQMTKRMPPTFTSASGIFIPPLILVTERSFRSWKLFRQFIMTYSWHILGNGSDSTFIRSNKCSGIFCGDKGHMYYTATYERLSKDISVVSVIHWLEISNCGKLSLSKMLCIKPNVRVA